MHGFLRLNRYGDLVRLVQLGVPLAAKRAVPVRVETDLQDELADRQPEFPLVIRGRRIRRGIHEFILGDHRLAFSQGPVEHQFGDQ